MSDITLFSLYSADGGIDVILDEGSERPVGVQVRRYRDKIGVSQIREFVGALMLGGFTSGIFITTSEFMFGARQAAEAASAKKMLIKLFGHNAFCALLGLRRQYINGSFEELQEQHISRTYKTFGRFLGELHKLGGEESGFRALTAGADRLL